METSIDTLTINIESVSKNALEPIQELINKLDDLNTKLQQVVKQSENFSKLKDNLNSASSGTSSNNKSSNKKQPYSNYGSKESQFSALKIDSSSLKKAFSEVTTSTALAETTTQKFRDEMGRVVTVTKQTKDGLEGYRVSLRDANTETKKSTSIFKSLTSGISGMALQFQLIWHTVSSIASGFGAMAINAGDYYETFNLFATTLGSQAEQGLEWVEMFSDALYLDPVNVMQYMGTFDSLIKGLGVGEEQAYLMSQQLTQLTYDLASFKNLDFETAFEKLRSGVAGELEPLRAVGVALSEATLQELAYTLGIQESVSAMSEAEKAQLRYIQIMRSSTDWQADMGKTLTTPTNALRVLREQFNQLGRAIGNVFLPILMMIVPYVMVVTEWLNTLAQTLANILSDLFGIDLDFSLDTGDFDTGVGTVVGGLEDIGSSADSAKNKLNTMLAPFDELNNVQTQVQSAGGGAGVGGGTGGDLGVDLPTYDALSKLTDQFSKNIDQARENLEGVLKVVTAIGAALLTWKLAKGISNFINTIKGMKDSFSSLSTGIDKLKKSFTKLGLGTVLKSFVKLTGGVVGFATAIMGVGGAYDAAKRMGEQGKKSSYGIALLTGSMVEATAGGALLGLTLGGPLGAAIGGIVGILASGVFAIKGWNDGWREMIDSNIFGDLHIETSEFADALDRLNLSFTGTSTVISQFRTTMDGLVSTFATNMSQVDGYLLKFQYLGESINGETGEQFKTSLSNLFTSANEIIDTGTTFSVELWTTSWGNMTTLTDEEQKKVLNIITTNGNSTKTEMQNAQNRINEIWQNAINTRGYLTDEEYKELQGLLNKIRELTNSEAQKGQADMEYYKKLFSDKSYQLDEESYNNFLEARDTYKNNMMAKIKEQYQQEYTDAQTQIDKLKKQQETADTNEYNELQEQINLLEKTQQDAMTRRTENEKELNSTLETYTQDVYSNITDLYREVYDKTDKESKDIRTRIEGIFKDANIDMENIKSQIGIAGSQCAKTFQEEFNKRNLKVTFDPNALANGQTSARVTMSISGYATGGFVDSADLFFANENGIPEMIGRIGNQTAVANNDQITTSITNALVSALDNYDFGGQSPTIIYLGNKKLYEGYGEHQERENDRYGVNMIRI